MKNNRYLLNWIKTNKKILPIKEKWYILNWLLQGKEKEDVPILPEGYQEVEYIQSTGTESIDTGVKASNNIKIEIEVDRPAPPANGTLWVPFGSLNDSTNGQYRLFSSTNGQGVKYIALLYGKTSSSTTIQNITTGFEKSKIILENGTASLDNGEKEIISSQADTEFTTNNNICLFSVIGNSATYTNVRIYTCKIWDNGVLVRNLIPCYKKENDEIGLYDLVNDTFYSNAGTGTFTKGKDIVYETEIQQVEYIEGTGTQYIDTNFKPNNNSKIKYKMYLETVPARQVKCLFGCRKSNNSDLFACFYVANNTVTVGRMRLDYGSATTGNAGHYYPNTSDNTLYNIELDKNKGIMNGESYTFGENEFQSEYNMLLLSCNTDGVAETRIPSAKIYYSKIYDNGTLVRDLIPCYRKSDSVIGLYDKVNKILYTNAGTGTFTKGEDI